MLKRSNTNILIESLYDNSNYINEESFIFNDFKKHSLKLSENYEKEYLILDSDIQKVDNITQNSPLIQNKSVLLKNEKAENIKPNEINLALKRPISTKLKDNYFDINKDSSRNGNIFKKARNISSNSPSIYSKMQLKFVSENKSKENQKNPKEIPKVIKTGLKFSPAYQKIFATIMNKKRLQNERVNNLTQNLNFLGKLSSNRINPIHSIKSKNIIEKTNFHQRFFSQERPSNDFLTQSTSTIRILGRKGSDSDLKMSNQSRLFSQSQERPKFSETFVQNPKKLNDYVGKLLVQNSKKEFMDGLRTLRQPKLRRDPENYEVLKIPLTNSFVQKFCHTERMKRIPTTESIRNWFAVDNLIRKNGNSK